MSVRNVDPRPVVLCKFGLNSVLCSHLPRLQVPVEVNYQNWSTIEGGNSRVHDIDVKFKDLIRSSIQISKSTSMSNAREYAPRCDFGQALVYQQFLLNCRKLKKKVICPYQSISDLINTRCLVVYRSIILLIHSQKIRRL